MKCEDRSNSQKYHKSQKLSFKGAKVNLLIRVYIEHWVI